MEIFNNCSGVHNESDSLHPMMENEARLELESMGYGFTDKSVYTFNGNPPAITMVVETRYGGMGHYAHYVNNCYTCILNSVKSYQKELTT